MGVVDDQSGGSYHFSLILVSCNCGFPIFMMMLKLRLLVIMFGFSLIGMFSFS